MYLESILQIFILKLFIFMLVILLTESNTSFLDTHALVKFLEEPDEPTCIVPINRIEK